MKKGFAYLLIVFILVFCVCCSGNSSNSPVKPTETPTGQAETSTLLTDIPVKAAERSENYITLTPVNDEYASYYISIDKIVGIGSYSEKNKFYPGAVVYATGNFSFHVKETAGEILKIIENMK